MTEQNVNEAVNDDTVETQEPVETVAEVVEPVVKDVVEPTSEENALNEDNAVNKDTVETQDPVETVAEAVEEVVEEVVEPTIEEKLAKAEENLLRSMADMQNTRRIAENDVMTARKYGVAPLARDLFTVAQNLRMALMSISDEDRENNPAFKNLAFGLDMVASEFDSAFEKNSIKKIMPAVGDDFNHDTFQAMGEVETGEVDGGKVAQVLSAGYMLHDRLLKPAMVNTEKKADKKV